MRAHPVELGMNKDSNALKIPTLTNLLSRQKGSTHKDAQEIKEDIHQDPCQKGNMC